MIELKNLTAGYLGKAVVSDISLEIRPGEVLAIIGPNGCGKSTLLKATLGLIPTMGGEVLYDGVDLKTMKPKAVARQAVLLLRKKTDTGAADPAAIAAATAEATARAMTETMRREVTEPILREERSNHSNLRTEMQTELRGSRTETTGVVQTSVEKLGQSLRESQRETADLQATRISELTAAEGKLMAELTAAQSLAKTYTVLLKNRTTLERLVHEIDPSGRMGYSWEDIYDMIESGPVDETEVMQVTVTCGNPYEAEKVANGIAKVLPQRVAEIVEGATMEVVDSAVAITEKVAPSVAAYTALGFLVGALSSVAVVIVIALMDNTVHDEEYVIRAYDYPILAKVPSLNATGGKKYSSYYSYSSSRSSGKGASQK